MSPHLSIQAWIQLCINLADTLQGLSIPATYTLSAYTSTSCGQFSSYFQVRISSCRLVFVTHQTDIGQLYSVSFFAQRGSLRFLIFCYRVPKATPLFWHPQLSDHLPSASLHPRVMRSLDVDPIAAALTPPENETPEERQARISRERAAKKVSDDIDEQLNRERQQVKRQPKPLKLLLLGVWKSYP